MTKLTGNGLKGLSALGALLAALTVSVPSSAVDFGFTGKVHQIRMHNTANINQRDWFTLVGLTSGGGCPTSGGFVILKLPARTAVEYKEMLSIIHAAKLAGRDVRANYSNSLLADGFCTVNFLHVE